MHDTAIFSLLRFDIAALASGNRALKVNYNQYRDNFIISLILFKTWSWWCRRQQCAARTWKGSTARYILPIVALARSPVSSRIEAH